MREDEVVFCSKCGHAWPRSELRADIGEEPEDCVWSPCCGASCYKGDDGIESGGPLWLEGYGDP